MADTIQNTQNTVYARSSFGVEPFQWAGKCTAIDRITKELGDMNPTFCQAENGGLQITGYTDSTPGLASTTVTFKETTVESLGDRLMTCLWDLDRRHHCKALNMWNQWDKITRIAVGRATSIDEGGSNMSEDGEELVTSLPWAAVGRCVIRRVAMSVQTFGGTSI